MKTKYIFEFDEDDCESKRAIEQAEKNYSIINSLYDDVFRPVIKYSDDDAKISHYQEIWNKIQELMYD